MKIEETKDEIGNLYVKEVLLLWLDDMYHNHGRAKKCVYSKIIYFDISKIFAPNKKKLTLFCPSSENSWDTIYFHLFVCSSKPTLFSFY